jgi:uncharacterized membrane protein YtjA (UPF0391 family)
LDENQPPRSWPERHAELTSWAIVYMVLGWLSLVAAIIGGAGEAPYFLLGGISLLPLGIGFWFRWRWARWAGLLLFAGIAAWAAWQLVHKRVLLLSIALLLTSIETLLCLRAWPSRPRNPDSSEMNWR